MSKKIVYVPPKVGKIAQRRMSIRFGVQRKPIEEEEAIPERSSASSCLKQFVHYAPRRFHPDTITMNNNTKIPMRFQSELKYIGRNNGITRAYTFERILKNTSKDKFRVNLGPTIVKDSTAIDGAVTMQCVKHLRLQANNASQMDFIIDILLSIDTPILTSFVLKSNHYTPEHADIIKQFLLNKPFLKEVSLEVKKTKNEPYCTDEDQIKVYLGYNFRCDIEYSSKRW